MTDPTTPTPDEIARWAAEHHQRDDSDECYGCWCNGLPKIWPCPTARLLALVAAQAEQIAAPCATCQGRNRATTDMVCMACGRDYMPDDGSDETGPGLGWLRLMQAWRDQAKQMEAERDSVRAELAALHATDDYQRWARVVVERDAAREAVARVRALHTEDDLQSCAHCSNDESFAPWPCATIAALDPEPPR